MTVNYTLIGRGVTNDNGIAHMTEDANGNPVTGFRAVTSGTYNIVAKAGNLESSVTSVTVSGDSYALALTSNKSVLSYVDNDSATLSATLTNNNVGVANELVTFTGAEFTLAETLSAYTEYNRYIGTDYKVKVTSQNIVIGNSGEFGIRVSNGNLKIVDDEGYATSFSINSNGYFLVEGDTIYNEDRSDSISIPWAEEIMECTINVDNLLEVNGDSGYSCSYEIVTSTLGAITDSNGVASVSYASQGIGDVSFQAEWGSILSETYEVQDIWIYDNASIDKSYLYDFANSFIQCGRTLASGGSKSFIYDSTNHKYVCRLIKSNDGVVIPIPLLNNCHDSIEISLKFTTNQSMRIIIWNPSKTGDTYNAVGNVVSYSSASQGWYTIYSYKWDTISSQNYSESHYDILTLKVTQNGAVITSKVYDSNDNLLFNHSYTATSIMNNTSNNLKYGIGNASYTSNPSTMDSTLEIYEFAVRKL